MFRRPCFDLIFRRACFGYVQVCPETDIVHYLKKSETMSVNYEGDEQNIKPFRTSDTGKSYNFIYFFFQCYGFSLSHDDDSKLIQYWFCK